jgi:hypothetical protein
MKPKGLESSPLLPVEILNRASALLVAREVRRPPETLAFLAQRILSWWTAIKGVPNFEAAALKSLAREFREMAFDCLPGRNPRWTPKQRAHAEDLFLDLARLAVDGPELSLPEVRLDLKPMDRSQLVRWIWNHLDYHVSALTIGLLGTRILAVNPDDPRFAAQANLRERVVQITGTLVALALYLAGDHGGDMPMQQAATTVSALLDGLAGSLEEAFALGDTRGRWLARCGGWQRPDYPCRMGDFGQAIKGLPPEMRPE